MKVAEYILQRDGSPFELVEDLLRQGLNPRLWDQSEVPALLKPQVRARLLDIAHDFIEGVDAQKFEPDDIVFTGSNANFNWTPESDVDMHLMVDFSKYGDEIPLIEEYFRDLSLIWNEHHEVKIYGHDLELYAQGTNAPLYATGVYSLVKNEWLKQPTHTSASDPDLQTAHLKAQTIATRIDRLVNASKKGHDQSLLPQLQRLREHIRDMRHTGLARAGEYAPENLAFKELRRNGYIDRLRDLSKLVYDRSKSLTEGF